jgi:hypothetical protein
LAEWSVVVDDEKAAIGEFFGGQSHLMLRS